MSESAVLAGLARAVSTATPQSVPRLVEVFGVYGALAQRTGLSLGVERLGALLLAYSPAGLGLAPLVAVLEAVNAPPDADREESQDVDEFVHWIGFAGTDADDIDRYMTQKASEFGYVVEERPFTDTLDAFIRARVFANSVYTDTFSVEDAMIESGSFTTWYKGFYSVYKYYYDHYGSHREDYVRYHELFALSNRQVFDVLVKPMNAGHSDKTATPQWMRHVILPYLDYVSGFGLVAQWLFEGASNTVKTYRLWKDVLESFTTSGLPLDTYIDIVRNFIASCYYDAFRPATLSSIETLKIYDTIKECCLLLVPVVPAGKAIEEDKVVYERQAFDTLSEFVGFTSLKPLIVPTKDSIITLSEIIDTCIKLYPFNKMTIAEFVELKYSATELDVKKREVSKILMGLNALNSGQMLTSISLFTDTFLKQDESNAINKLIASRLLACNLFDDITHQFENGKLGLSVQDFHDLLLGKFWDCFGEATNFDDRSGRLHDASVCVSLLKKLQSDDSLDKSAKSNITRVEHLMKVFANIKNFKITIGNKHPTPSILLQKFSTLPLTEELRTDKEQESPMGLITIILEQNPKSYLAFEKLFKILNDFLLFLNDGEFRATYYFERLTSACIEASLVDNNFSYAYKKSLQLLERSDDNLKLNYMWLTFYQIGRYMSPDWYDDSNGKERLEVLTKQSEILSKYLLSIKRSEASIDIMDNSRLIVDQWTAVNRSIDEYYERMESQSTKHNTISRQLQENITATANEILNDAAHTTTQASEKLSNLLVSGLGWAIGASNK